MNRLLVSSAAAILLTSCATRQEMISQSRIMAMSYDNIEAKVVKAKWPIVQSLGELRYWKSRADSKLPANMETFDIWSLDGQQFQVLVLTAPTIGPPDESHILAYLRNSDGDIIDWASELQSGYSCSSLYAELMDVNNNSLEELCFVRHLSLESGEEWDEIVAAYAVYLQRFASIIVKHTRQPFQALLATSALPNGVVIRPQFPGIVPPEYYTDWDTCQLYEILVHITNSSDEAVNLEGCYLQLSSGELHASPERWPFDVGELMPKQVLETNIQVKFFRHIPDVNLKFSIQEAEDHKEQRRNQEK